MAREGLTAGQLARRAELDERTIKAILSGQKHRPHAQTLYRLATGLEIEVDELFRDRSTTDQAQFDEATNPHVKDLVVSRPELFIDWTQPDFEELFSQVGTGGALTPEGALEATAWINRKREIHAQVDLILETADAELLAEIVEVLYRRVVLSGS